MKADRQLAALLVLLLNVIVAISAGQDVTTPSSVTASSESFLYRIEGRVLGAGAARSGPIRVLVDGGKYSATVRTDGSFTVYDVVPGAHLVEIVCTDFAYLPVRVDLSSKKKGRVRATLADDPRQSLGYPLILEPFRKNVYFEERQEYNLLSMLKQPTVLFTVVIPIGFIVMFKFIDPKAIQAELNEAQGNGPTVPEGVKLLTSVWGSDVALPRR